MELAPVSSLWNSCPEQLGASKMISQTNGLQFPQHLFHLETTLHWYAPILFGGIPPRNSVV
jgi:hypothetical protein